MYDKHTYQWLIGWAEIFTGLATVLTLGMVRLRLDVRLARYFLNSAVRELLARADLAENKGGKE